MPLANSIPVGDKARPHIESIYGWLDNKKLVGRSDGFGNKEYKRDEELDNLTLPLLDSLGLKGWGYTLWRFSNATPLTPTPPFWLVPVKIVAGEPCLEQEVGKPKVKLEALQKIHIEDDMEVMPELDYLFIVPVQH